MNLPPHRGVLVSDVTPGGPAAKAGLARGDVIVAVNGNPTNTSAQLRNQIALAGTPCNRSIGRAATGCACPRS